MVNSDACYKIDNLRINILKKKKKNLNCPKYLIIFLNLIRKDFPLSFKLISLLTLRSFKLTEVRVLLSHKTIERPRMLPG